jgi:hypothetical protein
MPALVVALDLTSPRKTRKGPGWIPRALHHFRVRVNYQLAVKAGVAGTAAFANPVAGHAALA